MKFIDLENKKIYEQKSNETEKSDIYSRALHNTITDVITLIRTKYSKTIDILLQDDILTLEYMYTVADDRDCFQLIQIKEFEDKLSIEFLTQHICKIINISELEDIFEMLYRKSTKQKYTSEEIKAIKNKYVAGTKIKLIKMYDLQAIPEETIGTVTKVDDKGQIQMLWENGSTLSLNVGIDDFEIINSEIDLNSDAN